MVWTVNTYLRCVDALYTWACAKVIDGMTGCFLKPCPGRCFGALHGWRLGQPQQLLKSTVQNQNGAFVEFSIDLVLTRIPENTGNLNRISKFKLVKTALAAIALLVFCMGNSIGYEHRIEEPAANSTTGDGQKKQWIANHHIHLATWNHVYN